MHDELCLRFHSIGWRLAGLSTDSAKGFFGIFGAFWSSRLHGKCIVKLVSSLTTIVEPTMIWSNDRVICNDDDDAAVCGVCVCVFVKVCQFPKCEKICCANIFIANARLIIANKVFVFHHLVVLLLFLITWCVSHVWVRLICVAHLCNECVQYHRNSTDETVAYSTNYASRWRPISAATDWNMWVSI